MPARAKNLPLSTALALSLASCSLAALPSPEPSPAPHRAATRAAELPAAPPQAAPPPASEPKTQAAPESPIPEDLADDVDIEEQERRTYVRPGVFASRSQALAPGVHVIHMRAVDVDLDGRVDEVLSVQPADPPLSREACVLARNTPAGWTAALLDSNIGSLSTLLECGEPVRAGNTVFLRTTTIHDAGREFGRDADRTEAFYVADSPSSVKLIAYVATEPVARGPFQVASAGKDALFVIARGPRYARVQWDPATGEGAVSAWSERGR